jgi:protocatechuate 3,4-dioxygenase beta subunit
MERKEFLKRGFLALGLPVILPLISCSNQADEWTNTEDSEQGACTPTASETEGPFPTKSPANYVIHEITSDRTGNGLTVSLTIQNYNNGCLPLQDAMVDIWHCDAAGNYSEYGGGGMQQANYTSVHFLRGRQITDTDGVVHFKTIYPGWYSGRAPHIHVHVYHASGKSLLITQIAFPETTSAQVYAQGVYASHGKADTKNANDNVFRDGISTELATITGDISTSLTLTHTIHVRA